MSAEPLYPSEVLSFDNRAHRFNNIVRVRTIEVLHRRREWHGNVGRGHALDRRRQIIAEPLHNAGREFSANSACLRSFLYYHNPLSAKGMTMLREKHGATAAQVWGGDSIDVLCQKVDLVWKAGVYSWAVLFHPATFDMENKRWKDAELTQTIERLKAHPGLLGWDLIDEPDGLRVPPEEVRRAFELVRRLDPIHAIWVNYCLKEKFSDYAGLSDFASYDHYPLQSRPLGLLREYNKAIREAFPDRPLLSCVQTYAAPGMGMPTPAQLRFDPGEIGQVCGVAGPHLAANHEQASRFACAHQFGQRTDQRLAALAGIEESEVGQKPVIRCSPPLFSLAVTVIARRWFRADIAADRDRAQAGQ